jgi:hypothetical protein
MLNGIHYTRPGIRQIVRLLVLAPILFIAACSSDPRMEALEKCVRLLEGIVQSRVLLDAVKNADPEMRATTAARGALTGGITANFPRPPDDISIVDDLKDIQPWSVILIGDDKAKQVRVEGYGSSIGKPAIVKTVKFPPG